MPSKSGSKYVITEDLRSEIAANSYNICSLEELIQKSRNKRIIAVGDVTTERLKDAGINLFMEVVDLKTKRNDEEAEVMDPENFTVSTVRGKFSGNEIELYSYEGRLY